MSKLHIDICTGLGGWSAPFETVTKGDTPVKKLAPGYSEIVSCPYDPDIGLADMTDLAAHGWVVGAEVVEQ